MSDAPDTNTQPVDGDQQQPGTLPQLPSILGGSGLEKIVAGYLQHLTANQPPPVSAVVEKAKAAAAAKQPVQDRPVPAPGSFGSKMADAAKGVMGDLGDAAHATDVKGGGWLSGVTSTLAARNQRLAQQQKDSELLAHSQAQTVALHRNFYQQDAAHRQQFHEGNASFFSNYKETNDQEGGVSQEDLAHRMKTEKNFAQNYLARATGETPVVNAKGEEQLDKNNLPVMKPVYTVMKIQTKDGSTVSKTVDEEDRARYKKYLGLDYPVGTKLTMGQDNALDLQTAGLRDTVNIVQNTNGGKELTQEQMSSLRPLLKDPTIQHAVSAKPGSAYAGIQDSIKNADDFISLHQHEADVAKQQNNQQALDTANAQILEKQEEKTKLVNFSNLAISEKQKEDYDKKQGDSNHGISEFLKDPTKIQGHTESVIGMAEDVIGSSKDPAVISQAKRAKTIAENVQKAEDQRKIDLSVNEQNAKEKAAKIDNNPNGLSGPAFIATLPVGRANLVRAIEAGRLPVNAAAFERSTAGKSNQLADDVFAAYPDFNATLGEKWPKTIDQYAISGNDHKKAQAFNVTLQHMRDLYDHTTANSILNPMSDEFQKRALDIEQVHREFGNAVASGVLTQSEAESIEKTLSGGLTPTLKKERVKEAAHLLNAKITEMQREFDALKPSANIQAPALLSPDAKRSFDYVMSNGGKEQPSQFQGKIGVPVPGDKTHYFNTQAEADNFKKLARIQ